TLSGLIEIGDLTAAGAKVASLTAKVSGSAGEAAVQAQLAGVTVPGPDPQLLAGAPVELDAHMTLDKPGRPLSFVIDHPLITIRGDAETAGERQLAATITIPDLRPIAAIMHQKLAGSATIQLQANDLPSGLAISSDSRLALRTAPAPALALLGPQATVKVEGEIRDGTAMIRQFSFNGKYISLDAQGTISEKTAAIQWQAKLPDLGQVNHGVNGSVAAGGTIEGPLGALALAAQAHGTLGTARFAPQPFHADLNVTGLPGQAAGRLNADAEIAGAPLTLALTATRVPFQVTIEQASWKSAHAKGAIALDPGSDKGSGQIRFGVTNLADFSALAGQALAGSAEGTLNAEIGPDGPLLDAHLRLKDVRDGSIRGSATLSAKGPIKALSLTISADAQAPAPASLTAQALINGTAGEASLSALTLQYRGLAARLLAPAKIVFRPGMAIRGLRLAAEGAEIDADGSLSPRLALTLALHNVTPALIRPFAPHLAIKGRLDATAKVAGSLTAPTARIEADARGLGLASELTAGLPPADLALNATIAGRTMHLQATLSAGSGTRVELAGTAPVGSTGTLDLGVNGHADLALLEPAMAASGRHIAGQLALNGTVRGTLAAPAIAGRAVISGGSIADYQSGLALSEIGGTIELANGRAEFRNLTAHAGPGTIALAGEIGILEPGMPVSLHLTADNAELLQSDRITLWLDSNLRLTGSAAQRLAIGGTLHVRRAEIEIPKSLPPNIAVLKVVRPGAKPSPPPASAPNVALDVTLDAPREIFVRGRGVDAEFGGRIHVSGTAAAPRAVGSLTLIRGAVSLAGQRLTFTSGTIGFNGGDPTDPTLDLVATASNRATTATLTLGGTVRKPTVTLSSVPDLPQDQVLAALLFGSATSSLSPFQIAEMANALASLTGAGPSVGNPLGTIRKALGLDQLSVGSDTSG
ncbi:MAG: translocation/assembly module TamB domain-containing protein, partial [Acetobacteraceae bacterium]